MSEHTDPKLPSEGSSSMLWSRISEHRIVQWTVGYVGLAYAIQHAVVLTGEAFEWPQTVQRVSMLLLALGVPLVSTVAWYHGGRANRRISGHSGPVPASFAPSCHQRTLGSRQFVGIVTAWEKVPVHVQRHGDGGMPESFLHDIRREPEPAVFFPVDAP